MNLWIEKNAVGLGTIVGMVSDPMMGRPASKAGARRASVALKVLLALLLAITLPLTEPAMAQQQTEPPPDAAADSYPKLRIVDAASVRRRPPLVARVALAPFNFAGSRMKRGLDLVEDHNLQDRLQVILTNPNVRPLFGSLGDGSGFGGGVAFSTVGISAPNWGLVGDIHVTTKKYLHASAGMRFQRAGGRLGDITLDVGAGYKLRPEEDFWGSGADPGVQRTNFNLQERSAGAALEIRRTRQLRFGSEVKYSATSIFAGNDEDFPSTSAVFGSSLPGLARGAELFEASVFAEYDTRNGSTSPVKALYLLAKISSVDGLGGGDFGYWRYHIDQRVYVPLGSERRVLAVRTLAAFTDTKGQSQVPFFRLARLGDTQTLRGYDGNRFYGRNSVAWNAEYRTDLTGGLGAFAFTDFGQVFDRRSEFGSGNFRHTYGGGLQLKSKKSIVLRAYVARSDERTRLMITFGPTF